MGNMDPNNSELKCDQESWTLNMKIFRNSLLSSLVYIFSLSQEWHIINLYQNKSKIMLWINIKLKFKVIRNNLS